MAQRYVSRHSGTFDGVHVEYTAIVEGLRVRDANGAGIGRSYTTSYLADEPSPDRPITFVFNGGPGVSSVWLHLGGLGPFRAVIPTTLDTGILPPYELAPSPSSLLGSSDVVFIDPINTGYGRADAGADTGAVDGVEGDADHVADVIRRWLERHGRLGARVFLLGESYGTIRAAVVATRLLGADNAIAVDGVALLGQVLNAQETTQRPGNVIGFVAAVPLLAVTASYHGLGVYTGLGVDELAEQAHAWSIGRYASALLQGTALPEAELRSVAEELSGYTGLPVAGLLRCRLRVNKEDFRRELLAERGLVLGLTDARYTSAAVPPGGSEPQFEPTGLHLDAAFVAAAQRHFTENLGVPASKRYRLADNRTHERWNYQESAAVSEFGGSPLPSPFALFDYAAHLRAYLRAVPQARLFIGTGHYDTLTTVGSARNLLAQNDLPADRTTSLTFPAGHMMYTDPGSAEMLGAALRDFVAGPR